MTKVRVLIVDDHMVFLVGLKVLINAELDMEVIGEARNGVEALGKVEELNPDIVIMDITMQKMNGIKAIEHMQQICPETKVLVLTMHDDPVYVRSSLLAGALGYLVKTSADNELVSAIRRVNQGQMFVDQTLGSNLIHELLNKRSPKAKTVEQKTPLTPREREVLKLLAQGYTYQQIADQMGVSTKTVETYRSRFIEKLGIRSRADIISYALHIGLLSSDKFTS